MNTPKYQYNIHVIQSVGNNYDTFVKADYFIIDGGMIIFYKGAEPPVFNESIRAIVACYPVNRTIIYHIGDNADYKLEQLANNLANIKKNK